MNKSDLKEIQALVKVAERSLKLTIKDSLTPLIKHLEIKINDFENAFKSELEETKNSKTLIEFSRAKNMLKTLKSE